MLNALRKSAGGIVAKVFLTILVLSFGVWGIADIFTGYGRSNVVSVGSTEISQSAFQRAFQIETQNFGRQIGRPLSVAEARQFGIDQVVLNRMISEAVLDEDASDKGVSASKQKIADDIVNDPQFKGPLGSFSRGALDNFLSINGLTEAGYVNRRIELAKRRQVAEALAGGITPSQTLQEAVHTFQNETRTARFITLTADSVTDVADPDDTTLTAYFEANKAQFRAPEYRRFSYLLMDPDAVASSIAISDEDIAKAYDERKNQFTTAERRTVRQIPFATVEEAAAAKSRIDGGLSFDDLANEMKLTAEDTDLGTVSKAEIFDQTVANAAFSLDLGAVSDPVKGEFRPVLLTVTDIQPGGTRPLDEVKETLVRTLQLEKARDVMFDRYDQIEDDRAAGLTLKEISEKHGLSYVEIASIDRSGRDQAGTVITGLPNSSELIQNVFRTDPGVETEPLQVGTSGSLWYEVDEVIPARDRTLDETRDAVIAAWKAEQVQNELAKRAGAIIDRVKGGETLDAVATADNLTITRSAPLKRSDATVDFDRRSIDKLFNGEVGSVFEEVSANGRDRLVVLIANSDTPPFDPNAEDVKTLAGQIASGMADDIIGVYVNEKRDEFGATINPQALNLAIGVTADGQ
ncbi:MAG: SurA N-terminal domain-containing protein [Rhodobiaceae bacterium]|nr:SurA N-terminal domain-containing protein [Rhodobiaceae bacterium]